MLPLNNFVLFVVAFRTVYCTRHIPSVESSYQEHILSSNKIADSLSCPEERKEMFSWCEALFSRAHYRYSLKVFSNQLGFRSATPECQPRPVTFVSDPKQFPTDRTEFMLQCIGRHEPLRTDSQTDDYYDKFLLAATKDRTIFYVFVAEKLGASYVFKFYEEILDMTSAIYHITEIGEEHHLSRERLLLTIPTMNVWPKELERIYFNEVIIPNTPIEDKLRGIQPNELYMLCAFLLTTASYGSELFIVDAEQIEKWDRKPGLINLYFDHINTRKHNGIEQVAYPCYGKQYNVRPTRNQKLVNLFQISSGPRERSLIVYIHLSNQRDYKIRCLHENVSLTELLAAGPSPQIEEAGPSEPARKRTRLEPIVPQDISQQLPSQGKAPQPTPGRRPMFLGWEQQYQYPPTNEPSPPRMSRPAYPSPGARQQPYTLQLNPDYQISSRDQQLPVQAAGPSYRIPVQQLGMQAGLPRQIPSTSRQLAPSPVGSSSHVDRPDRQLAILTGESPQVTSIGQQLTPSQLGTSNPVLSQDQQPVIQAGGFPILPSDDPFQARADAYFPSFQSTDETDQLQPIEDYGFYDFAPIPDPQASANEGGLLFDALNQFKKDDPGPSGDS